MKKFALYGYTEDADIDCATPSKLKEITLVAEPDVLRRIASFLEYSASQIEEYGTDYDHNHLGYFDEEIGHTPVFVVARPHWDE